MEGIVSVRDGSFVAWVPGTPLLPAPHVGTKANFRRGLSRLQFSPEHAVIYIMGTNQHHRGDEAKGNVTVTRASDLYPRPSELYRNATGNEVWRVFELDGSVAAEDVGSDHDARWMWEEITANVTLAQRTKAIRAELKTHGITARQVSVRSSTSSWSESIYIEIKDLTVSRSLVEMIAAPHASQRVDDRGHSLMGGNRYVEVRGIRGGTN